MCLVCVEWQAGKLTSKEALSAVGELINSESEDSTHYYEVVEKIMDKEVPFASLDSEIDQRWHDENHE